MNTDLLATVRSLNPLGIQIDWDIMWGLLK